MSAPDDFCDSAMEHPLGLWILCDAKGPHSIHWGYEQVAPGVRKVRRWTDAEACNGVGAVRAQEAER